MAQFFGVEFRMVCQCVLSLGGCKARFGKGTATKSALVSFVLAFDTFRFDSLLINEGGSTTPVYGYGWGAILWLASIAVILMAAGARELELSVEKKQSSHAWGAGMRAGGILALVALLCMTVVPARQRAGDSDLASFKIYIVPLQRERLSQTHAGSGQGQEEWAIACQYATDKGARGRTSVKSGRSQVG